ncbi:Aminopeptidase-like protein AC3.5 [Frankliniella fusca]|uniref:Aminopeptidase-like protein AC3.5 n=1 Tax=Frankliniella fusca TaxID=407009 RepID=A0AAE1LTL4_9NEOP|nr:Aminopeptidase-like protein AC3.5 [Frankliniella fusca]
MTLTGLPEGGLLLNGARAGYYRVNYDAANWALLTEALEQGSAGSAAPAPALSDLERAGLVDDALALAGAGRLGYDVPLALLGALPRDGPSLAWVAALPWLTKLTHLLHGAPAAAAGGLHCRLLRTALCPAGASAFSRWARALAADLLHTSEGVRLSTDPVDHAFVERVQLWACGLGVPGCLGPAGAGAGPDPSATGNAGRRWVLRADQPMMRFDRFDLCGAQKSEQEWNEVLTSCLKGNQAFLLKLADCIQSQEAARRMLEILALESNDEELAEDLLKKLTGNPYSYDTVINFLQTNLTQLQTKYGSIDIAKHTLPFVKSNNQMIQLEGILVTSKNSHLMNDSKHNVWWLQNQAERLLKEVRKLK